MKAALIVPKLLPDFQTNLETIQRMANNAVNSGAKLILFPEASITGLINNDDPVHDLPLGQEIPGPITNKLSSFCRQNNVCLGIGMIEREDKKLYDSAVLINPRGSICLKYRRNHPQWHGRKADPDVYCQGTTIPKTNTSFGTVSFLICGDLFDDDIVSRTAALQPDWVFYLLARSFDVTGHEL